MHKRIQQQKKDSHNNTIVNHQYQNFLSSGNQSQLVIPLSNQQMQILNNLNKNAQNAHHKFNNP